MKERKSEGAHDSLQLFLCLVRRSLRVNFALHVYRMLARIQVENKGLRRNGEVFHWYLNAGLSLSVYDRITAAYSRVRRCLLRCVVRVNLAGQCGHSLV